MTRLPSLSARGIVAALKRGGFEELRQKGSHLFLWHPVRDLITTVPMHAGDMPCGTVRAIIRQAGLKIDEFLRLL